MRIRPSILWGIGGLLWMVAAILAARADKPVALLIGCGTVFLALGTMALNRERKTRIDMKRKWRLPPE